MLQPMGSQRVGHDWATKLNWTERNFLQTEPVAPLLPQTIMSFLLGNVPLNSLFIFDCFFFFPSLLWGLLYIKGNVILILLTQWFTRWFLSCHLRIIINGIIFCWSHDFIIDEILTFIKKKKLIMKN